MRLRARGLKMTTPRLAVLEMLRASAAEPLGAKEIYRRALQTHDEFALGTVYRVLRELQRHGYVSRDSLQGRAAVFAAVNRRGAGRTSA